MEHDKLEVLEPSCEPALLLAIRCDCSAEILRLLLDHGADVNSSDAAGATPLSALALAPKKEQPRSSINVDLWAAQRLVRGLEADAAVPCAAALSEAHCCELASVLLAFGADPLQACNGAANPADLAENNGRSMLAGFLRSWSSIAIEVLGLWDPGSACQGEHSLIKPTFFKGCRTVDHTAQGA